MPLSDSYWELQSPDEYAHEVEEIISTRGRMISLSDYKLSNFPNKLAGASQLEVLALPNNKISIVPSWIRNLANIRILYLQNNDINFVSSEIGQLRKLEVLCLQNNNLTTLPSSLLNLPNLKELYLHGNPGLGLPDEIMGPTFTEVTQKEKPPKDPKEILDYLYRIQGEAGHPLNECKLIVVGRGGSGKTSIVKRLNLESFDPDEPETHGITISKLDVECDNTTVTCRVWDFGGQIILHSMTEGRTFNQSFSVTICPGLGKPPP